MPKARVLTWSQPLTSISPPNKEKDGLTMTTLYNCHTDGDQYRITKFDSFGNVESTYLCTVDECECPAGFRPSCRHRHMLPRFIAKEAVNSFYFYDYDRQGWVTNEPAVAKDSMFKPAEPAPMNGFEKHEQEIDAIAALAEPAPPEPPLRRRI